MSSPIDKSVVDIANNFENVMMHLSSIHPQSSTVDLLDKLGVVLEELRTISILAESQTDDVTRQLKIINDEMEQLDRVLANIDSVDKAIEVTKSHLSKLESLCTYLERS